MTAETSRSFPLITEQIVLPMAYTHAWFAIFQGDLARRTHFFDAHEATRFSAGQKSNSLPGLFVA